ncbi:hypothetical protein Tco_0022695 [Tanacetum coccineum]
MYHQKNVDYVYLLWEDLGFQIENKVPRKNKDMYYLRFTKLIINHFMSQDQLIPRRNKLDWHMAKDDPILTTMRFIPQHKVVQKYGAILLDTLTNQAMKESEAYKTYYAFASGKEIPNPNSHASSSGADEGTGVNPGVPDVPAYESDDEHISWKSSDDENDDVESKSKDDDDNANDQDDDDKEDKEEEGSDMRIQTPSHYESTDNEESDEVAQGGNVEGEELDEEEANKYEEVNELYRDMNINLERRDTEMTDVL